MQVSECGYGKNKCRWKFLDEKFEKGIEIQIVLRRQEWVGQQMNLTWGIIEPGI